MKTLITSGIVAASILFAGCSKKENASGNSVPPKPQEAAAATASAPVAQPAMTAWQQGDKTAAINSFVETDWNARPLFAAGSVLNLSEDQFMALSAADREAKSKEMLPQISSLKQMGTAVAQAGRDAASKGDTTQARKYFTSLKQFGAALDSPDRMRIVQLVGQALKKMADAELAKVGQ